MIPIVLAFTPNYLVPAATTIKSVLDCTTEPISFVCLSSVELPQIQKNALEEVAAGKAVFDFLVIRELPDGIYTDPRYSEAAQYRLLLPELLPQYDRILYLDCDIIVRNDPAEMVRRYDVSGKLLGAVYERNGYFNSGVMIMNLEKMRSMRTSTDLMNVLRTDYLEFPDQDALNKVCGADVVALPPCINSIRTFLLPQYRSEFLSIYTEKDIEDISASGNIHYTGGKPWNIFTVAFDIWWKCYFTLPDSVKKQWKVSLKMRCLSKVYTSGAGKWLMDTVRNTYRKIRYCV